MTKSNGDKKYKRTSAEEKKINTIKQGTDNKNNKHNNFFKISPDLSIPTPAKLPQWHQIQKNLKKFLAFFFLKTYRF